MKNLESLKYISRHIVLTAMCGDNSFSLKDYKALSTLLCGIDKLEIAGIPPIRFGILADHGDYVEEFVIEYNSVWYFRMDGIERTARGSDSYEREYLQLDADHVRDDINIGRDIDVKDLEEWYHKARALQESGDIRYTLEYYFLDE